MQTAVGNWPGKQPGYGNEMIAQLEKQAVQFGAKLVEETVTHCNVTVYPFELTTCKGTHYRANALIIATGSKARQLDTAGTLEYIGQGIFTNEMIYNNLDDFKGKVKDKTVLVIGGGVDAMKKAAYAIQGAAKKVYIATRNKTMNISPLRKKILDRFTGIEILAETTISAFHGVAGKLTTVTLTTGQVSKEVAIDYAVISTGRVPNSDLFKGILDLDEEGAILLSGSSQKTKCRNVFAAGDVTTAHIYGQAAIAAGDGMKAGYEVVEALS